MPSGAAQSPGGWNRFAIEIQDLDATVARLTSSGARFRNAIVDGVGGRQIIVEDPSGNPIELFQPTIQDARLGSGHAREPERGGAAKTELDWTFEL